MIKKLKSDFNKMLIIQALRHQSKSIADLSKELKVNRSTLNYYLLSLKSDGKIESERIEEKVTGRPTIISLTSSYKKQLKQEDNIKNKSFLIVLKQLKEDNGIISLNDFFKMGDIDVIGSLLYTIEPKLVEHYIKITPEGKNFLAQNETQNKKSS